jgi:hypothetical protein
MKYLLIFTINIYQKFKPKKWEGSCIYNPTCSSYGILALRKYGLFKGTIITFKRIKRCDHNHIGGIDLP